MNPSDLPAGAACATEADDLLSALLRAPAGNASAGSTTAAESIHGIVVGELLALTDLGAVPLVRYPGQPDSAALRARSTIDLHGPHVGATVVLMFEQGDPLRPIVMGLLREPGKWPFADGGGQVDLDADGNKMTVSAHHQLVLRCGKASITLTRAGKVLIEGSYVLSRSTGMNRIKGGSVQLN